MKSQEKIVAYFVAFSGTNPVTFAKTKADIRVIKSILKIRDIKKAQTFDSFYFDDIAFKNDFIESYNKTKSNLSSYTKSRDLACILNKKHYLILAAMKIKTYTVQKRRIKDISVDTLVNLYDQTNFITVKITDITELENGKIRYDFELA